MPSTHPWRSARGRFQFDDLIPIEIMPATRGGAPACARLLNLSCSGAAVEVDGGYPVGTRVSVSFQLPEGDVPITCWATVRRMLPGRGVGIEFHELPAFTSGRIGTFLERQLSTSGEVRSQC